MEALTGFFLKKKKSAPLSSFEAVPQPHHASRCLVYLLWLHGIEQNLGRPSSQCTAQRYTIRKRFYPKFNIDSP